MKKSTFKDLIVWQKSMDLVVEIYMLTKKFPSNEMYGLVSQMRRSAVSIPSNIAEGKSPGTEGEWKRFLSISYGSLGELETQIELAKRLEYLKEVDCIKADGLIKEVGKMLNAMTSPSSAGP